MEDKKKNIKIRVVVGKDKKVIDSGEITIAKEEKIKQQDDELII